MSPRVRGVVLVCSLAAAVAGVMVALDSQRGEPGDIGRKQSKTGKAYAGAPDGGGEVWSHDVSAGAAGIMGEVGPTPGQDGDDEAATALEPGEESGPESDPDGPVVELASGPEGPLYVVGSGIDGLTPQRTRPLGAGTHRLRLVGGRGAPPVVLLLNSQPPRLDATLSGDGASSLDITCRGGIAGPEPITTAVGARLVCWLRGPTGTLTVEMRVVDR
ncbi:MAG: hypothetical protein R3F39_13585 [Myxococcota bacterium]